MTQLADSAPQTTESETATALLVRCLRCEYDLRGLGMSSRCPECGLAVEPSHQRAEIEDAKQRPPLRLSSTAWLRNIAVACCIMLIAALLAGVDSLRIVRDLDREEGLQIAQIAVGFGQIALLLVASWLFGTRAPLESRGGTTARYVIRICGLASVVLPFALMPLVNRFGSMPFFFSRVSALFGIIAAVFTFLVVRRLAAGARRAEHFGLARFASCFAWLVPPIWVIHAILDPSMPYEPHAEWLLNAHPIIGYVESVVAVPSALRFMGKQWDGESALLRLWPWMIEALISAASLVLLAMAARVYFIAAAQSPRPAPEAP